MIWDKIGVNTRHVTKIYSSSSLEGRMLTKWLLVTYTNISQLWTTQLSRYYNTGCVCMSASINLVVYLCLQTIFMNSKFYNTWLGVKTFLGFIILEEENKNKKCKMCHDTCLYRYDSKMSVLFLHFNKKDKSKDNYLGPKKKLKKLIKTPNLLPFPPGRRPKANAEVSFLPLSATS